MTNYYWRVKIDDGATTVNYTYDFKTQGVAGGGGGGAGMIGTPPTAVGLSAFGIFLALFALIYRRRKREEL